VVFQKLDKCYRILVPSLPFLQFILILETLLDLFLVLQNGLSSSSPRSNVCALYVTVIFASPQSPSTPATVIGP
jgi:hypothetical protein